MKTCLVTTVLCTVFAVAPVLAQQGGQAPSPARGGSTAPLPDFGNGGRPESHGGDVQIPGAEGAAPSQNLPADTRQALEVIGRNVATAQQYGNLASMRTTTGAMHELGAQMITTNSRIDRELVAIDPKLKAKDEMPPEQRSQFDSVARHAEREQFAASVAQWVVDNYPHTISAIETVAGNAQFRGLAATALPELKSQLSTAQTILQTAGAGGQPRATGSIAPAAPKRQSD